MNHTQQPQFQYSPLTTNAFTSVQQGTLAVTIIPATEQLDWIVPTALILAVIPFDPQLVKSVDTVESLNLFQSDLSHASYPWQQQSISIYPLVTRLEEAKQVVVLEAQSDEQRLGILVEGSLSQRDIKLSDIKDIEPKQAKQLNKQCEYALQLVSVAQHNYVVPDLAYLT